MHSFSLVLLEVDESALSFLQAHPERFPAFDARRAFTARRQRTLTLPLTLHLMLLLLYPCP